MGVPGLSATHSAAETVALGRALAETLKAGDIVLLCGPMGAGKTYFAKGLVAGLGGGDEDDVASPAYDIVHQFPGRVITYHYDLFRLRKLSDDDVEWLMESLLAPGMHVVEWGDRLEPFLKRPFIKVVISPGARDEDRVIEIEMRP